MPGRVKFGKSAGVGDRGVLTYRVRIWEIHWQSVSCFAKLLSS